MIKDDSNKNVMFFVMFWIILVFLRWESLSEQIPHCDAAIAESNFYVAAPSFTLQIL